MWSPCCAVQQVPLDILRVSDWIYKKSCKTPCNGLRRNQRCVCVCVCAPLGGRVKAYSIIYERTTMKTFFLLTSVVFLLVQVYANYNRKNKKYLDTYQWARLHQTHSLRMKINLFFVVLMLRLDYRVQAAPFRRTSRLWM